MKNKIRNWYVCTVPSENEEERKRLREFKQWCIKTNKNVDINCIDDCGSYYDFEVLIFPKSKAEHNRVNKKLDSMGIGYGVFGSTSSIGETDMVLPSKYKDLVYKQ